MGLMRNKEDEVKFLRELFLEKPHLSVDQAAKECDKFNFPIHKGLISDIRRNVRGNIGRTILEIVPPPVLAKAMPKVTIERVGGYDPEDPKPDPTLPLKTPETKEARLLRKQQFVESMALENPKLTPKELIDLVKLHFDGQGANPRVIQNALRLAREIAGVPLITPPSERPKPQPKPQPKEEAVKLVDTAKQSAPTRSDVIHESKTKPEAGEFVVSWGLPGDRHYDTVQKAELHSFILRLTAKDEKNIKVHKEVPFKIKVSMEID